MIDDAIQPDGSLSLDQDDDGDGFARSIDWSPEHGKAYLEGFWSADELEAFARHMRCWEEEKEAA